PMSVNIQTIILGNVLAIAPADIAQLAIIGAVSLTILLLKWKEIGRGRCHAPDAGRAFGGRQHFFRAAILHLNRDIPRVCVNIAQYKR
ncbi:metal ABC transporter permease, partial [Salmonella enterica subsp. enterica serovar Anatum]|nr:metal ABC transporter permease [Salmonella enterica subsp. enterica serovar Anatum]